MKSVHSALPISPKSTLGSSLSALVISLALHLLLWQSAPYLPFLQNKNTPSSAQLTLNTAAEPIPNWIEEALCLVDTNPQVSSNQPDPTNNLSERDQQEAQPLEQQNSPDPDLTVDGELAEAKNVIHTPPQTGDTQASDIEGIVSTTSPSTTPNSSPPKNIIASLTPPPSSKQIFDDLPEDSSGVQADGLSPEAPLQELSQTQALDLSAPTPQQIELSPNTPTPPLELEQALAQAPQARPRLNQDSLPTVIRKSSGSTLRIGELAINADDRFLSFVKYNRTMFETIVKQWYLLAEAVRISAADGGTYVKVEFSLSSDGRISDLKVEESSASSVATLICQDAIQSPAPYAQWTEEMHAELDDPLSIGIGFYY